ncbi:MAG: OsmC family protein [Actinomycetota bacterium]
MGAASELRQYGARARSTDIFGRVLCSGRENHFVVDGPVWNGCPGEAVTPGELFLAGVAACAVELLQVIARERDVGLGRVAVVIDGTIDRNRPVRPDLSLFNAVRLGIELVGVTEQEAGQLVKSFKGR